MRKLIFGINVSIDGVCDHSKLSGDPETHDYFIRVMEDADLLVYGRKTYELMVPFWPDVLKNPESSTESMIRFAKAFETISKLIFSRTLPSGTNAKTTITGSDAVEEIRKIKQEPGGNILVGGVDLPSQLTGAGLVDEFRILVHPAMVGEGRRLDGIRLAKAMYMELAETKVFESGTVALRYVKK